MVIDILFLSEVGFLNKPYVLVQSLEVQHDSSFLCWFGGNSIVACQNSGRHIVALEDDVEIFNAKLAFYAAPPLTSIAAAEVLESVLDDEPPARDVSKKNRWAK